MKSKSFNKYRSHPDLIFGSNFKECSFLMDSINRVEENIKVVIDSFIKIGSYLDDIKNNSQLNTLGYESFYEFVEKKYNLSKTTTDNLISAYLKFGKPESILIDDKYVKCNFSQLLDLINIKDAIDTYLPSQLFYESKLNTFINNINHDEKQINLWYGVFLFHGLKRTFKNCIFHYEDLDDSDDKFLIEYKKYFLKIYLCDEDIFIYCDYPDVYISYHVDFSYEIVLEKVSEFIEKVDSIGD